MEGRQVGRNYLSGMEWNGIVPVYLHSIKFHAILYYSRQVGLPAQVPACLPTCLPSYLEYNRMEWNGMKWKVGRWERRQVDLATWYLPTNLRQAGISAYLEAVPTFHSIPFHSIPFNSRQLGRQAGRQVGRQVVPSGLPTFTSLQFNSIQFSSNQFNSFLGRQVGRQVGREVPAYLSACIPTYLELN